MHNWLKNSVAARSFVVTQFKGYGLVDQWANPVAHIAAQPQEVEASFLVNEDRQTHAGLLDIR